MSAANTCNLFREYCKGANNQTVKQCLLAGDAPRPQEEDTVDDRTGATGRAVAKWRKLGRVARASLDRKSS